MLDANIIFTVLWTKEEYNFDAVNRDFAIDKYGVHDKYAPIKPDPKAAIFCGNYFYWVSNELSMKGGKVDMNKAYSKLNDLINCVQRRTLKYEYKR